jgi:ArsR family transcriptional regulator
LVGYNGGVAIALPVITERERLPDGCHTPRVEPDLSVEDARDLAAVLKALANPTRLRVVDALRIASPEAVCQCELLPLFDISQAALAKHLRVLVTVGLLGVERRGLWAYYFIADDTPVERLRAWLA